MIDLPASLSVSAAHPLRRVVLLAGALALLGLGACSTTLPSAAPAAGVSPRVVGDTAAACEALKASISPAFTTLGTSGATIESVLLVAASAEGPGPKLPFAPVPPETRVTPAMPEHCRVIGRIGPIDPSAPAIRFQVNLPSAWNGRSLQFGGGGFNGVLINGLSLPPSARIDQPGPLARGFVTYGTDSGHQNAPGVPLQAFALNDEALINFSHAAYKKVRDVAVELMKRRYGSGPAKLYFVGSSEGGREGLLLAQRYPADFDGIFSRVPVIHWTGLQHAGTRFGVTQTGEGWLPPALVARIHEGVLEACDALDGLKDGIVSHVTACRQAFTAESLACGKPGVASPCLTPAQVAALQALYEPYRFSFPLAHGVREYPAWGRGGENAQGTGPAGGWPAWQTGPAPQSLPAGPQSSRAWLYGSGAIQYFMMRDPTGDPRTYRPEDYRANIESVSALMDATNPDLSAFHARGGKLIVSEHLADYAQSPYAGIVYFRSVQERMGAARTDEFMRLYLTPGADHIGGGAPTSFDPLDTLVRWVEQGQAPGDLEQVTFGDQAPWTVTQSRPMCRYPAWPRYRGQGDPSKATSFDCARD